MGASGLLHLGDAHAVLLSQYRRQSSHFKHLHHIPILFHHMPRSHVSITGLVEAVRLRLMQRLAKHSTKVLSESLTSSAVRFSSRFYTASAMCMLYMFKGVSSGVYSSVKRFSRWSPQAAVPNALPETVQGSDPLLEVSLPQVLRMQSMVADAKAMLVGGSGCGYDKHETNYRCDVHCEDVNAPA